MQDRQHDAQKGWKLPFHRCCSSCRP